MPLEATDTLLYKGSYPALCLLTPFWLWSFWRILRSLCQGAHQGSSRIRLPLFLSLALTLLVFWISPPDFKILGDETNYLSLSHSLWRNQTIRIPFMAHWLEGRFIPLLEVLDRRPLFFPFIVSLVHFIFGYSPENIFIANAVVFFLFLFLLFVVAKKLFPSRSLGILAALLLCQPILVVSATSGGIDLLSNLVYLLLCISGYLAWKDAAFLSVFWLQILLMAQTRHEGVLYLVVFPVLVWMRKYSGYLRKMSPLLIGTALLLLPRLLQIIETSYDQEEGPLSVVLSPINVIPNGWNLLLSLFGFGKATAFAPLVFWLAIALSVAWYVIKKLRFSVIPVLFLFPIAVPLLYRFGQASEPVSARYFIWLVPVLSFAVLFLIDRLILSPKWVFVTLSFLFLWEFRKVPNNAFISELVAARGFRESREVVGNEDPHRTLVVSETPEWWVPMGNSAMSFKYFDSKKSEIAGLYHLGKYQRIIWIEKIPFSKEAPALAKLGGDSARLLTRRQIADDIYLRFSEVRHD